MNHDRKIIILNSRFLILLFNSRIGVGYACKPKPFYIRLDSKDMLTTEQLNKFRNILETEKNRLEGELEKVGKRNPDIKGDWVVEIPDLNAGVSDENDLSDIYEELENKNALGDNLEESLVLVNKALERVKRETYGFCEICKKPIDGKRLEAYPAATTCVKHTKNNSVD